MLSCRRSGCGRDSFKRLVYFPASAPRYTLGWLDRFKGSAKVLVLSLVVDSPVDSLVVVGAGAGAASAEKQHRQRPVNPSTRS